MSQLLSLHNRIKSQTGPNRLAGHQRRAYAAVMSEWRFPARLNLCGPPGCGKTYLGWVLAQQQEAMFLSAPEQVTESTVFQPNQTVIVDNTNPDSYVVRRLLAVLDLHNVRRALLISTVSVAGILPTIAIEAPTLEEIAEVRRNLSDLGFRSSSPAQPASLWALVRSTLS